jgi:hypothetical protein
VRNVWCWFGVIVVAAVSIGCGGNDETPVSPPIAHASGSHDLIVSYAVGDGLIPFPGPNGFEKVLLYGDGRLLVNRDGWRDVRLTEDGVQRVLRVAVEEGGFLGQPDSYQAEGCADCPTTVIAVNAAGQQKTVEAYALGIATPAAVDGRYGQLVGLARFFDSLSAGTFRPNEVASSGVYQPGGVWAKSSAFEAFPPTSLPAWPGGLPPLTSLLEGGAICGAQATSVRALATGGQIRTVSSEGTFAVMLRDLFPHDPGAAACGL